MGQTSSNEKNQFRGIVHPNDQDRVLIFNYDWYFMEKYLEFGDMKQYEEKYEYRDEKNENEIINAGGQGCIVKVKNAPDLVAKHLYTRSMVASFRQYVLMKSTDILYYDSVYRIKNRMKGKVVYVMEKLKYSLLEYVLFHKKSAALTETETKTIMFDVLNCLYKIHQAHMIHFDLCPHNIMYRDKDFTKNGICYKKGWVIIDYDSIIICAENTNDGGIILREYGYRQPGIEGKPGWTPPEKVGSDKYTYGSDLWSMGLIILFTLFKKHPLLHRVETNISIISSVFSAFKNIFKPLISQRELISYLTDLKANSKLSHELYALLRYGLLVYDPKKRMKSVEEVYKSPWFDEVRETMSHCEGEKNDKVKISA